MNLHLSCFLREPRPKSVVSRSATETTRSFTFAHPPPDRLLSSVNTDFQQPTSCGHYGIGQDLCHLCHRRTKLNVPVYFHEERRIREAEEDKLLNQYRDNRDIEEQNKQDVN